MYRRAIWGYKRALDGPRKRLAKIKKQAGGEELNVQELEFSYNVYGLPLALLVRILNSKSYCNSSFFLIMTSVFTSSRTFLLRRCLL